MLLDNTLVFCTALNVSGAVGVANTTDVFQGDLDGQENGNHNVEVVIQVTTAFAGAGGFAEFRVVTDGTGTIATDGSATVLVSSGAMPVANLPVGRRIVLTLPSYVIGQEQFMGLQVVRSGATLTAGSITAFLVLDAQQWRAFADAVN